MRFSRHAQQQMARRRIGAAEVSEALTNPETSYAGRPEGRVVVLGGPPRAAGSRWCSPVTWWLPSPIGMRRRSVKVMRVDFDPEVRAWYITLSDAPVAGRSTSRRGRGRRRRSRRRRRRRVPVGPRNDRAGGPRGVVRAVPGRAADAGRTARRRRLSGSRMGDTAWDMWVDSTVSTGGLTHGDLEDSGREQRHRAGLLHHRRRRRRNPGVAQVIEAGPTAWCS